jgi:hypothetical protein
MWVWSDNRYAWQPGFWINNQPGWMWVPGSYFWTPSGYVYNQGYWDYPLENRGMAFAPVSFSRQILGQPGFLYTPTTSLLTSSLLSSLFVRPAYGSYYFGDYYAPNNFQSGIYPWYSFHGSRYGYDPLYAHAAARNLATNPNWANDLHQIYQYRRTHPEARPPRTFAETRVLAARPSAGAPLPPGASNLVLARPLDQLHRPVTGAAPNAEPLRLERIDQARRQQYAAQARALHDFRQNRLRTELEGSRAAVRPMPTIPRRLEMARSPIVAHPVARGRTFTVPTSPRHPDLNQEVRPPLPGAAPLRLEPRPETAPPRSYTAPAPPQAARPRRR